MNRRPLPVARGREAEVAAWVATTDVSQRDLPLAFAPSQATRADLFVDGTTFYPAILRDLEAATSSIQIIEFGFRPGVVGDQFAELLLRKAAEGIPVRLLVDARGSDPSGRSRELYRALAAGGVQVGITWALHLRAPDGPLGRSTPPRWNLRSLGHIDHRKVFVIDGRVGWVGGAGIEDHFSDGRFLDVFVRVEGPVVRQLQLVILASQRRLGLPVAADDIAPFFPPLAPAGDDAIPAVTLLNAPGSRRITAAIARLIDQSRETLDVANPYLSDRWAIGRLRAAARRGVRVRLLVPAIEKGRAALLARHAYHAALLADGVEIWGYPRMIHAKVLVRDGEEALVGSCNLEVWSLRRFFDLNLRLRSTPLAQALQHDLFEPSIAISRPELSAHGAERLLATLYAAAWPLI